MHIIGVQIELAAKKENGDPLLAIWRLRFQSSSAVASDNYQLLCILYLSWLSLVPENLEARKIILSDSSRRIPLSVLMSFADPADLTVASQQPVMLWCVPFSLFPLMPGYLCWSLIYQDLLPLGRVSFLVFLQTVKVLAN